MFKKLKILVSIKNLFNSFSTGILFHGFYLGGVFYSIFVGLPTAIVALIVTLQPILTNILAGPFLKEKILLNQWIGIFLGFSGASIIIISDLIGDLSLIAFLAGVIGLISSSLAIIWQKK